MNKYKRYLLLIILFLAGLIWSGISPKDYFIWALEVFPAILGIVILGLTFKKFKFTYFTYCLVLVHCFILFIGAHYTYAEVPLFDLIRDIFVQSRNNYDKAGHFAQGFFPAIIIREIFIRLEVVKKNGWLNFIVVCICLSISAVYEFIEWFVAVVTGESADAFLGTQGYIWDTQSDMLLATIGAIFAVVFLSGIHDRQIEKYKSEWKPQSRNDVTGRN
ncbi:MAG: DUF2238 domain-containing protein [Spirochaetes bacterium]|nr:DUF2238 domain-containing protein [Spirochaetota bacterium]